MATTGPTPHINDLTDEEVRAIAAECETMGEFTAAVRGARNIMKQRLAELELADDLANGSDLLAAAGIHPLKGRERVNRPDPSR